MPQLTIDGRRVEVSEGTTILQAAKKVGIKIPVLCQHPDQDVKANCRICVVEVAGQHLLQPACAYAVYDGMVVRTSSAKVRKARRNILELLLAHHPQDCLYCVRNNNCELQSVAADINYTDKLRYPLAVRGMGEDFSSFSIVRDPAKCICCGRCEWACSEVQATYALTKMHRGFETFYTTSFGSELADTVCVNCGQCVQACPVAALTIQDDTKLVWDAIADDQVTVVAQVAPAVRVNLAEALGEDPGAITVGRLVTALKQLGVEMVFDTDFAADLTILEEGTEFIQRLTNNGVLPMITSCSPGWVKFCETFFPDQLEHLSSAKSPQSMFGAIIKTWYAQKLGKTPQEIFSLSIMPCTAKKYEAKRPELGRDCYQDIDAVLTVAELAKMITEANLDFKSLADTEFDKPFGLGSGAGVIFGASGGVMEAALRTVYEVLSGEVLADLDFVMVRGFDGVKEATIKIGDLEVKVAVCHGLANARRIMEAVRAGTADYHFIEVMACPGGCVGGGGNAYRNWSKVGKRMEAIYRVDKDSPVRKSHENPAVHELYKEMGILGPGEGVAHQLFHTHYLDRSHLND